MPYAVVRHTVDLPGEHGEGELVTLSFWCLQAPDGQRFTVQAITHQEQPGLIPEVLQDLARVLNDGRNARLGDAELWAR